MLHLIRDPRSLAAAFGLPVALILLYGYAVNLDVEDLPFAVVDHDVTQTSRRMIECTSRIPGFRYLGTIASDSDAERLFEGREASAVLVIPRGFASSLARGEPSTVQVLLDGTNATTAQIALGYTQGALARAGRTLVEEQAARTGLARALHASPIDVRMRVLYNPSLKSQFFLVPGLIAIVLMLLSALLTSGVVVRERERGSFELLASSPVSAPELVMGKLTPYLAIASFDVVLAVGAGWLVFGVEPRGSLPLLFVLSLVFVATTLAIGLLVSCLARTQQVAMLVALVSMAVPTMLLSGFVFPVRNMPVPLRLLSEVLPATHYVTIMRAIVLKGVGLTVVAWPAVKLSLIAAVLVVAAARSFRKRL